MSTTTNTQPASATNQRVESFVRKIFLGFLFTAGLGVLCQLALVFWAQNEFSQPESVVGIQSKMLAREGTLYYDLKSYPYTVCAYTPIFYFLEAALFKLGLPIFVAGRLISFVAMIGILSLLWRLILLYTRDPTYAWTGLLLCAATALIPFWGTVGQVDTLAVCLSIAAFHQYSVYAIEGKGRLLWAAAFAVAAFFTKQTMLACPAAIFILLWINHKKTALRFGAGLAGTVALICLILNMALDGRFLANTVFANLNPFAFWKLEVHARYAALALGQLIIIAATGARSAFGGPGRALYVYLGLSATELILVAPKIGSDSNYQIEASLLLVLCACMSLHALNFFNLIFRGSKTWITLLQLPLAVHCILNMRITVPVLIGRVYNERQFRTQTTALRPYLTDGGRVISTDIGAMVHLGRRLEVEPLIYSLLVTAGRLNPEPLRRDIAAEVFPTILLYENVNARDLDLNSEVPTLPTPQLDQVKTHYKLVDRIPGPYLGGIYVYKRLSWVAPHTPGG